MPINASGIIFVYNPHVKDLELSDTNALIKNGDLPHSFLLGPTPDGMGLCSLHVAIRGGREFIGYQVHGRVSVEADGHLLVPKEGVAEKSLRVKNPIYPTGVSAQIVNK